MGGGFLSINNISEKRISDFFLISMDQVRKAIRNHWIDYGGAPDHHLAFWAVAKVDTLAESCAPWVLLVIPFANEVEGVYWFHFVRLSVRLSVDQIVSTLSVPILTRSISFLRILSINFRRCVTCWVSLKILRFEFLLNCYIQMT